MKLLAPQYMAGFKCIAQRCRRSCCKGWEIDIDEESLERFKKLGIGAISEEGTPHFILKEGDVCPHLRDDGLCSLIICYSEDVLCDICRDHPRFRNFWTGFAEVGLGLACEEAARIILSGKEPIRLTVLGDCDENGVLSDPAPVKAEPSLGLPEEDEGPETGGPAAGILRDRKAEDVGESIDALIERLPEDEARLYELRENMLAGAADIPDPMRARLAEYLIFRHLADALYDGRFRGRIGFINRAFKTVTGLWERSEDKSFETLCELAGIWSEKTEYNEELKDSLIEEFERTEE